MPDPQRILKTRRLVPLILPVTLLVAACSSMDAIDRRVERVIGERSGALQAPPAAMRKSETTDLPSRSLFDKHPDTKNPTAAEIDFNEADPNRPIIDRLDGYYRSQVEPIAQADPDAEPPVGPALKPIELDLEGAFRIAQRFGREYRTAEEDYIFAVIRLLIERHRWGPRFFNDTTALVDFTSNDGDYSSALRVINELRATQRLPYGGEVEARLVTSLSHQLMEVVGERNERATSLILSAGIPLLRNAGLIAQEDLIQAERDTVYAARQFERFRREYLVSIAQDYFNLVAALATIANQENSLLSRERLLAQRQAEVRAGRVAAFDERNVRQNVLRTRVALVNARESYQLALDRFKIRLGLPVETDIIIQPVNIELPEPEVGVRSASMLALEFRLDFQNALDALADARRAILNAKNQLLPNFDLGLQATFNTDDNDNARDNLLPNFDLEDTDYAMSVTFGLPLDREIERLTLRQTTIRLQQAVRNAEQFRDSIILSARAAVREIDRARFALTLQEEAIVINLLRLEQMEIQADEIDALTRLDAENELLQSQIDRDLAQRDLRVAILNYLLTTGQMRVRPDGTFQPLQGMVVRELAPTAGAAP